MKQSKNNLVITMAHVRAAGGCAPGARTWFREYGLDFRAFARNGIDAQTLLDTGDAFAIRTVNIAEAEKELNNGG